MTELFLELRSGRINEADVAEIIAKQGDSLKEADFKLKLQDILLLYRGFERNLIGSYIEKEDILTALTKKIETLDLSQTTIYIESYQSFNAQEQELIGALLKKCKDVTIALNLDQGYPVEKPALHELFYATGETYYQLYQLARNGNIPVKQDCIISEKSAEYSEELNQLEDFWLTSSRLLPSNYSEAKELISVNEGIEVWAASDKQAEVTHVAKEIRRLVESGKYRYQDVLVLTRHLNDYRALVNPIFKENDIELFNDQAETMNHHPLVEFVLALLAIKKYNWRYQDIMRLLRTELLIPVSDSELPDDRKIRVAVRQQQVNKFRSQIDIAENVILAYGYEGYHWTSNKPWHYTKFVHEENAGQTTEDQRIEEISNSVRLFLKNLLEPLFKKLDQAKNGLAAAEIVYTFLESSGVSDQIAFWRDQAIESGDLETSKEHEQAWDTFLQLLDEYVEVLGETSFDLDAFYEIIMTGFEQATYSMIPPSIDQVTFSSIESTRIGTTKVTFILGMTEVNLPAKSENASVLTETDRELFSAFFRGRQVFKAFD
ncbi:ATP-dependent helicase/deoxyribonuclease subunit B (fragment) [Carnobacterium maltaromaticum]